MRNKKLLSTIVATALVTTTMALPVVAADGGEVDVDVTTRTAVIRVQVPTSLEIAVNQFEKGDKGSQVYSEQRDSCKTECDIYGNLRFCETHRSCGF